jgi:predicted nucleic acid-binding protein
VVTAVDSSVIFDLVSPRAEYGPSSRDALGRCVAEGRVLACEVVWAEVAGAFPSDAQAQQMFDDLGIEFSSITLESAIVAGKAWKEYREHGGPRARVAPDFLIGAHALSQADRLLTRESGFYRTYLKHLRVLDPSHH